MIRTDRMLRAKEQLLEKFKKMKPRTDPSRNRLPPGQHLTKGFPVLDLGIRPRFDPVTWRFRVEGEVEQPLNLTWAEFTTLPKAEQVSDFHCVTTWSKHDVRWGGVKFHAIVARARPKPLAQHLILECADGYTANLPLAELQGDEILLAYELDGGPLPLEHGGPLRMIVPHLYAWKSAKFLNTLRFQAHDTKGYWEVRGYHNHADPWKEERFG
jgi:DMSO/TMAO reductase YedYZ molybdopterin-dependent catalytic subunit